MKIEFTDEKITKMAEAISVCESLEGLSAASANHVLCVSNIDSQATSLKSYKAGYDQYADMIKPIVERYKETCFAASQQALMEVRRMFRDIADGKTLS